MTIVTIYKELREEYSENLAAIPMTFCEELMEYIPTRVWEFKQSLK